MQVQFLKVKVATHLAIDVLCCHKAKNLALGFVLRNGTELTACRLLLQDTRFNTSPLINNANDDSSIRVSRDGFSPIDRGRSIEQ